ncbi:hypothetical protein LCGC14_2446810 [marine sediment metagenome]|uniref:Uncharacterized protein n=1 Tax=marine sediment metagenome TaxID=412755 RepID=A0A0F9DUG1_9ZZZZ
MNKHMKFNPIFWFFAVVVWLGNHILEPVMDAVDEFYKVKEKD